MPIATVTNYPVVKCQPGVCVSTTTTGGEEGCVLNVFRPYNIKNKRTGFNFMHKRCDHDGKWFPDNASATDFALSRGYLQPYYHSPALKKLHRELYELKD